MSDFNIKKFLAESVDPFLATLKQHPATQQSWDDEDHFFQNEPKPVMCPDCEGEGTRFGDDCTRCGGHGEVFESSDEQNVEHSDQMDDEDYDVPAMEGYEFGDIVNGYDPRLIAQDMLDGGISAISDANFDDLYAQYMGSNGDPSTVFDDDLKEAVRKAYKAILKNKAMSGSDFNKLPGSDFNESDDEEDISVKYRKSASNPYGTEGNGYDDSRLDHDPDEQIDEVGDVFMNDLSQLKEFAGIEETAPQGAAPAAQLKGKDKLKGKGVKGYNDAHPASGQLVGETGFAGSGGSPDDWASPAYDEQLAAAERNVEMFLGDTDPENAAEEAFTLAVDGAMDAGASSEEATMIGREVADAYREMGMAADSEINKMKSDAGILTEPMAEEPEAPEGQSPDDIFRSVMGWDEEEATPVQDMPTQPKDYAEGDEDPLDDMSEFNDEDAEFFGYDPRSLEDELLGEYDDFEDDYEEDDDEYYEEETTVRIRGRSPEQSYWNNNGKFQNKIGKLEELIPAQDEVDDAENNPALERFRSAANCYYDVYNNGLWDEGRGQRGEEFEELFGLGVGHNIDTGDLEELIDDVVHEAWEEQSAKGTVSEEQLDEFLPALAGAAVGSMLTDDDDDLIGKGDVDAGDNLTVSPGQTVQVDSALGGEATVVAQRSNYLVVKLPKGGMKLLRDDEWWMNDEDEFGSEDGYVDVEGGYEEPDELTFEAKVDGFDELPMKMTPGSAIEVRKNGGKRRLFLNYNGERTIKIRTADAKIVRKGIIIGKDPKDLLQKINKMGFAPYNYSDSMNEAPNALQKVGKWAKRGFQWGSDDTPGDMVKRHQEYDTDSLKNLQDKPGTWKTGPAKLQQKLIKRNLRKRGERDFEKYMDESNFGDRKREHEELVARSKVQGKQITDKMELRRQAQQRMDAKRNKVKEDQASVMPQHAQDDRQNHFFSEGYKIMPPMDPKYVERDGLEGPFSTHSGKVVYYDPKAGKHYDPDTDMYMDYDEFAEYDRDPDMIYPEFTTPAPKPRERGRMDETGIDTEKYPQIEGKRGPFVRGDGHIYYIDVETGNYYMPDSFDELDYTDFQMKEASYGYGRDHNDEMHSLENDKAWFKRQEMQHELGHEDEWNRRQQAQARINPRTGHPISHVKYDDDMDEGAFGPIGKRLARRKFKKQAKNLMKAATDQYFGPVQDYDFADPDRFPEEDKFRDHMGNERRYSRAAKRLGREDNEKAYQKAIKKHDKQMGVEEGKTRTYTGDLATTEVEPPYGGFSRLGMKDLAEWIKLRKDHPRWAEMVKKAKKVLAQKKSHAKFMKGNRPPQTKYKYTIAKQVGGDDGYQWAVIDKKTGHVFINGLTRPEVKYYRDQAEADLAKKYGVGESINEYEYDTKDKGKGAGWSAGGDGGKKNRKNRKAFRKAEKKRKHDAMMRGEKWAQEPVDEAIIPWDSEHSEGDFVDDESGQIHRADDVIQDPETGEWREKTQQEQMGPEKWAEFEREEEKLRAELDAQYAAWDAEDEAEANAGPQISKMGWDAIGDFGDVAGGGGDPIDFVMQKYGLNMESIDAEAVNQGYADAYEWAESYRDLPTEGPEMEESSNFKKGYKNKGGAYTRPGSADEKRAGGKFNRKDAKGKSDEEGAAWAERNQVNEIETASDQLASDRAGEAEQGLGDTNSDVPMGIDSDAELAGMQQLIKNVMQEPDQDMEQAIQQMAMANTDPADAELGTDEVADLKNLLGLLK